MPHLRRFIGLLAVGAVLAPAALLATGPAAAQSGDTSYPVKVFVLVNGMSNTTVNNELQRWQVQVTVRTLNNCTPTEGMANHTSSWLDAGEETGVRLSLTECLFTFTADVREASSPTDCRYAAQLAWGTKPADSAYVDGRLLTSSRPGDESRISVRRRPGSGCASANQTYFRIDGEKVVEELPAGSADAQLSALARRAAAISTFTARIQPDYPDGVSVPAGCDRSVTVDLRGDGERVSQVVGASGGQCLLKATVVWAQQPFETVAGRSGRFDGALPSLLVDLTSQVRLPTARIAIVQDVVGSGNRGTVSYAVDRSCGGVAVAPPPVDATAPPLAGSVLYEGRFTVHSPDVAAFGAVATYPAVAAGTTSQDVVGCSVAVTIGDVPATCVVDGPHTRVLTWTDGNPIRHFDFEFDLACERAVPSTTTTVGEASPETPPPPPVAPVPPPPAASGPPIDAPTG